jgi:ribonucleotide reductase beta subunit family protein with ferritin-like domain
MGKWQVRTNAIWMEKTKVSNDFGSTSYNRRAQQIGLDELHPGATNPFPWMAEMIDLKKEKNFFETRVTEYQTGGALSWD